MQLPVELQTCRRVAVFGVGRSGLAATQLLQRLGIETHVVNQGEPAQWIESGGLSRLIEPCYCHSQDGAQSIFAKMDLIVLSPGIPTTHEVLSLALSKGIRLVSEIELAWWVCRNTPVIAITGSNGKTTTTTMIAQALKLAGKQVFIGGNIGIPYCEMALEKLNGKTWDYAVIEVSSFQLETSYSFHPKIALILNLTVNHTERYENLDDYGKAKWRLVQQMDKSDHLILGKESGPLTEWAKMIKPTVHLFEKAQLPSEFMRLFDFKKGVLRGMHNEANYFAAWKTLQLLNIPELASLFQRFIESFKGVEHRLEFVGEFHGLKIYNDAKSTNGEATKTALAAFKGTTEPFYLIVGGKLRNETDKLLPDLLPYKDQVSEIFTIGMTTERLQRELGNDFSVTAGHDLTSVLKRVRERKLKGNLVFSPAHPSFDQFKSYVHRGETFKQLVKEILA